MPNTLKEAFYMLLTFLMLALFAEGVIRVITVFHPIYDVEMIEYALTLKQPSQIPGVSHEHIPNSKAHLMGTEIALNSMGHRNPELRTPKPANEKRIHFIGSSIILGWGVPEATTIPALTSQRLNQTVATQTKPSFVSINAGIGNYNAVYTAKLFTRQIDQVAPDLVVFQYHLNDAEPDPIRRDHFIFKHSILAAFLYLRLRSIWVVRNETLADYYARMYQPDSDTLTRTKQALLTVKKMCDERGIPLIGLHVPEMHDLSLNGPYPPIYRIINKLFLDLGIPLIDPVEELRTAFGHHPNTAWVAKDDPHPSTAAHAIMAEKLSKYLASLPW